MTMIIAILLGIGALLIVSAIQKTSIKDTFTNIISGKKAA